MSWGFLNPALPGIREFPGRKSNRGFQGQPAQGQVHALVHEKLYQSEDMASVDFSDYIQNLTDYLFHSYSVGVGNVSLKLDVDKIFLGMDTAIPLGIIINELVSNSLKHAFAGRDSGEISISLKKDGSSTLDGAPGTPGKQEAGEPAKRFLLVVRDNGVGFPEDLDFRDTDSLGLQLALPSLTRSKAVSSLTRAGEEPNSGSGSGS